MDFVTAPTPYPAGLPTHPLDYWLSPALAAISPPNAPTRLRQLADAQASLAAAWSSAIAGGPALALSGAYASVLAGNSAPVLVLGAVGAALMFLGVASWKRVRGVLPNTNRLLISRGPGNARSGIYSVLVLGAAVGVAFFPPIASTASTAESHSTSYALIGAYLLILALLVACITVPSAVIGRGRRSFRVRLQSDSLLRQAVEHDLATWRDPYGNASYGPL